MFFNLGRIDYVKQERRRRWIEAINVPNIENYKNARVCNIQNTLKESKNAAKRKQNYTDTDASTITKE